MNCTERLIVTASSGRNFEAEKVKVKVSEYSRIYMKVTLQLLFMEMNEHNEKTCLSAVQC